MPNYQGLSASLNNEWLPDQQVDYTWPIGTDTVPLNALLGQRLQIHSLGVIECVGCGQRIRKAYQQGYCFPCTQKLAQCDLCIVKPELCHFHLGTCREPSWGEQHCLKPHIVYLANSSGLKVGITRVANVPYRWMDQGATQALPIVQTSTRMAAGLVETLLKGHFNDRTDWRKMLMGEASGLDLRAIWAEVWPKVAAEWASIREHSTAPELQLLPEASLYQFHYPIVQYPAKVRSLDLDKQPEIDGVLQGIKGQYLLLDCGVLNVRKWTGYHLSLRGI